jgi:alkylated DNA nucleotide flippase Atl1
MASTRAPAVAEVLWELKRADKVATFSAIATRAGFSAGANGRAMLTCLKTIRKDWPHLQWWRAIRDDGTVKQDGEQAVLLREWGVEIEAEGENGRVVVRIDEALIMVWEGDGSGVEEGSSVAK